MVSASSQTLGAAAWHYLEWLCVISTGVCAGQCVVKVDGVSYLDLASGTATKGLGGATANQLRLGSLSGTITLNAAYDDCYIADRAGSIISTFLGDSRIEVVYPVSDGGNLAWSNVSGTCHVSMVMETYPNSSTNYVITSTVNNIDSYKFSGISAVSTVKVWAVQLCLNAQKSDAGTRELATFISASGTASVGTSQALATGFAYYVDLYTSNPAQAVCWAVSTISAAEFGVKLTT
jgi:hypothetical protein